MNEKISYVVRSISGIGNFHSTNLLIGLRHLLRRIEAAYLRFGFFFSFLLAVISCCSVIPLKFQIVVCCDSIELNQMALLVSYNARVVYVKRHLSSC